MFVWVSFFSGMLTFVGYLMLKPSFVEEQPWFYLKFGLVSLINDILTFVGYLMLKPSFVEEQQWYYLTHSSGGGDKGFHIFPRRISPKENVIARLNSLTTMSQSSTLTTAPRGLCLSSLVFFKNTNDHNFHFFSYQL